MLYLLAFITVAATVTQLISFRRMLAYVGRELKKKPGLYLPRVALILPCKGLDQDFEVNIQKLLAQDYLDPGTGEPKFEVIFALGSKDDPAYAPLQHQCDLNKSVRTQVVVASPNPHRAHKVNSQLAALDKISPDAEVLVFVDSDVIARQDFLRYLVMQLDDPKIGATTGYRFYIPFKGDWPSLIRSLWNRVSAWELANPDSAFAWGGAMAARKDVFERAQVRESWERSADDDLALTTAIKKLGRQLILTKIYYPELWRRGIARALVLTVWLLAVLSSAFVALFWRDQNMLASTSVGLSLIVVELLFLFKAQKLWSGLLEANMPQISPQISIDGVVNNDRTQALFARDEQEELRRAYERSLWRFSAVLPLAHLVLPWMTLYSITTNRIKWRGITYELRSPTETLII